VQSDIRASGAQRFGRVLLFQETKAIILLMALFFLFPVLFLLFFAPVVRLLGARAFSFTISMAFPVSGAHRRPVNRLYFTRTATGHLRRGRFYERTSAIAPASRPGVVTPPYFSFGLHCSSHCFFIDTHCSCVGFFSLAGARPCIVIGREFPL
jgi:hypothetical protein